MTIMTVGRIVSITWGAFILALVAVTLPALPYLVADVANGRIEAALLIAITYGMSPAVAVTFIVIGMRRAS